LAHHINQSRDSSQIIIGPVGLRTITDNDFDFMLSNFQTRTNAKQATEVVMLSSLRVRTLRAAGRVPVILVSKEMALHAQVRMSVFVPTYIKLLAARNKR
jgi:hypothetical protein